MRAAALIVWPGMFALCPILALAESPAQNDAEFARKAQKLREAALLRMEPQISIPTDAKPAHSGRYAWKTGIVTSVFWIGSRTKKGSDASAWDPKWQENYGGFDDPKPERREHFFPSAFVPRLNPFYIALPYNDVINGATKPEARIVIPWFRESFIQEGVSVCRNRWLAIRNSAGMTCYAQWSDCGPFRSDHWQYVFGNEKPKPNANGGAGINVSPAVRDYLGLSNADICDWRFVEVQEVPDGPWALHGENNDLVRIRREGQKKASETAPAQGTESIAPPEKAPEAPPAESPPPTAPGS